MSSLLQHLREGCRDIREISTAGHDSTLTGIGGSPYTGDMSSVGLAVPAEPTVFSNQRYLFRLAALVIPSGQAVIILGLRQLITLYAEFSATGLTGFTVPVPRPQTSPLSPFFDGNVSWHLRHKQSRSNQRVFDPNQPAGMSPNVDGRDPALLYSQVPPAYVPPRAGIPPGEAIGTLGTFYDVRFPWEGTDWGLNIYVEGPGDVVLYASVHQTDPSIRIQTSEEEAEASILPAADTPGLTEDQAFVSSFVTTARYGRVAGSIIYEPSPCCAADSKGNL